MRMRTMRRGALVSAVVAAALATGALPATASPRHHELASAYALEAHAQILKGVLDKAVEVDVPPIPRASSNGPNKKSVAHIDLSGLGTVGVLNAAATHGPEPGQVDASASTLDVDLEALRISAKVLEARCGVTPEGKLFGTAKVVELRLGDRVLSVEPVPNTTVKIAGLRGVSVTLNEQYRDEDELTVNALHIRVDGALSGIVDADVILSSATCTRVPVERKDNVPPPLPQPKPRNAGDVDESIQPVTAPPPPPAHRSRPRPKGAPETGIGGTFGLPSTNGRSGLA